MGAMRWAELESEMADTGVKVGTNAGNVNVPEDVPKTLNLCQQYSFPQLMRRSLARGQNKHNRANSKQRRQ